MSLHWEKRVLFFFILLLIGSQIVSAQNEYSGRILAVKSNLPNTEIEKSVTGTLTFSPSNSIDETQNFTFKREKIEFSETVYKPEIKDGVEFDFRTLKASERNFDFSDQSRIVVQKTSFPMPSLLNERRNATKNDTEPIKADGFKWRAAFTQSLMFLGVQHGYAILGQRKTRVALKGKFWKDYIDSVKDLHGWDDGGRFFTNYIAHPMQGSLNGFIYVQNSPQALREQFSMKSIYWKTRLKAMLWTSIWSTQFEIGPISQASIGNVGLKGKQTWEDIVTTPTLGTMMLVTEDALDRFIIKNIERRTNNFYIKIFSRMIFNPTRVFANLLRFKQPWYRDRPNAH